MKKKAKIDVDAISKTNPKVDLSVVNSVRADIKNLRKAGVVPSGYRLMDRRLQSPLKRVVGSHDGTDPESHGCK